MGVAAECADRLRVHHLGRGLGDAFREELDPALGEVRRAALALLRTRALLVFGLQVDASHLAELREDVPHLGGRHARGNAAHVHDAALLLLACVLLEGLGCNDALWGLCFGRVLGVFFGVVERGCVFLWILVVGRGVEVDVAVSIVVFRFGALRRSRVVFGRAGAPAR